MTTVLITLLIVKSCRHTDTQNGRDPTWDPNPPMRLNEISPRKH